MLIYSTTQVRSQLSDLVNQVKYTKNIIAIGRNKKAEVLITPIPETYDIPITEINTVSSSFSFLENEPELYSLNDLKKSYV